MTPPLRRPLLSIVTMAAIVMLPPAAASAQAMQHGMAQGGTTAPPQMGTTMPGMGAGAGSDQAAKTSQQESAFMDESAASMNKMIAAMGAQPTGDIDMDFVAMMNPHHQGAIDMAQTYLRFGHNEQLRRIAQEIIVEQQQEITAMQRAIGGPLPPSAPVPTQLSPAPPPAYTTK